MKLTDTEVSEERLQQIFRQLRNRYSGAEHEDKPSYYMDCDCVSPDENEKYDDIEELIDEWLARNCLFDGTEKYHPIKSPTWSMYYLNWKRARAAIPLVVEFDKADNEYEESHSWGVCLNSPTGWTFCEGCQDPGYEDFGVEEGPCRRQSDAKEAQDEFWYFYATEEGLGI